MSDTDGRLHFWVVFAHPQLLEFGVTPPAVGEIRAANLGTAEHILRQAEWACSRQGVPWPHLEVRSSYMNIEADRAVCAADVRAVRRGGHPHGFGPDSLHPEFTTGLRLGQPVREPHSLSPVWMLRQDEVWRAIEVLDDCVAAHRDLANDCRLYDAAGDDADRAGWAGTGRETGSASLNGVFATAREIADATTVMTAQNKSVTHITTGALAQARHQQRLVRWEDRRRLGARKPKVFHDLGEVGEQWPQHLELLLAMAAARATIDAS